MSLVNGYETPSFNLERIQLFHQIFLIENSFVCFCHLFNSTELKSKHQVVFWFKYKNSEFPTFAVPQNLKHNIKTIYCWFYVLNLES